MGEHCQAILNNILQTKLERVELCQAILNNIRQISVERFYLCKAMLNNIHQNSLERLDLCQDILPMSYHARYPLNGLLDTWTPKAKRHFSIVRIIYIFYFSV